MINFLISLLQGYDPVVVSLISVLMYFSVILVFFRLWGQTGLILFIVLAVIGANLQVLKISYFGYLGKPVALGTELFATAYLCTDLLSEHYGLKAARRGVYCGFAGMLLWTAITSFTLAFSPLTPEQAGTDYEWALSTHQNLSDIFTILPVFLVSGLTSYLVSQLADVYMYDFLYRKGPKNWLWLRNNLSTIFSSLVDNIVFSTLAFVVLSDNPIGLYTLVFTYILGTYVIRVGIALFDTPFIYLSKRIHPPDKPRIQYSGK